MNESESHEYEEDELADAELNESDSEDIEEEDWEEEAEDNEDDPGSMEADEEELDEDDEELDEEDEELEDEDEEYEEEDADEQEDVVAESIAQSDDDLSDGELSAATENDPGNGTEPDEAPNDLRVDQASDSPVPSAHLPSSSESPLIASLNPEALEPVEIEAGLRQEFSGPPVGIRRANADGLQIYDSSCGRASVFGFGFDPITEAIQEAAENYLGDGADTCHLPSGDDILLREELAEFTDESINVDSVFLRPSADDAIETAIELARKFRPNRYRTIALVGSDHGRTGLCRTASGQPALHEAFGPMMAGFAHVPVGDLAAIRNAVDDNTACVLLSPIDLCDAARPIDPDYLAGIRQLCDEHNLLLIIDETRLMFGCSGRPLAFSAIADVKADVVVLAGGLFGGLAGGLVVAAEKVTGETVLDVNKHPLLAAVASETLASMKRQGLPISAENSMRDFAVALAETLSGYEFVRDVNVLGNTIGIEFDIDSLVVVRAAERQAIRIQAAGSSSVRLQLPLIISAEEQETLLTRLGTSMETIEREATELTV